MNNQQTIPFSNNEIDITSLPKHEDVNLNSIEKRYRNLNIVSVATVHMILFTIVTVLFVFNLTGLGSTVFIVGYILLSVLLIWSTALSLIRYKYKGYAVREHDIIYKSGIFSRITTIIPYNRIQHIEISQGFLDRMFNLSKIKIYTAGGAMGDMSISGLSLDKGSEIKNFISDKTANITDQ